LAILVDGCISETRRIGDAQGRRAVLKERPGVPPDLFVSEAAGLRTLAPSLRVPEVLGVGVDWILLEDFGPQVSCEALPLPAEDLRWEAYGRAYARLHARVSNHFGWSQATYWGLMRMDQTPTMSGAEFYAERRFRWFLRRPALESMLTTDDRRRLDTIAERLAQLVPDEAPCCNHGDLWAGNRALTPDGELGAIDPFVHNGWAECDLHNCTQFGGFPERFFAAYAESRPLEPGWRGRQEIWYLLHLLGMLDQRIEVSYAFAELRRITRRFVA
jgi:protein-ribulosamine 3-kinase